ncbi:MAG: efflux RND transporter permease subunit [Bacillota bacterium]
MLKILNRWIQFQRNQPVMFWFLFLLFLGYGIAIAMSSEIEAFPEFTNVQVQVITQFPGKAAEEVERQITQPLEVAVNGLPGLINQRSISIFGLSVITLTFDDNVKSKDARLDVSQRLGDADLPDGVKPSISPDTTPVGEIFRYTVTGTAPLDEMRLVEDWTLEREFKSIPGVADVVSFGGPTRTVEVHLDLSRMKALGLSISTVAQGLGQNHANAGGTIITHGEEGYIVRSIGLYETPQSLESAVITTQKNIPVRVRDIGTVELGHKPRLGVVGHNENDDVVEGIILLRHGADSLETCKQIREKIEKLNSGVLPPNVQIRPYYDRTDLIKRSSHTVFHNIIFGILLVCLILWFGFGRANWPLTLAVALIIPFSLLIVFVGLKLLGYTPNLISLGAVDFGIIIETAIFSAEAMIHGIAKTKKRDDLSLMQSFASVLAPALLCALMLVIAFIPILSLQRVEGRIFRPLGVTLIAALIGGQLGTFLFLPIAAKFLGHTDLEHSHNRFDEMLDRWVEKCLLISKKIAQIKNLKWMTLLGSVLVLFILCIGLGREFLPKLNEGSMYIRATGPSTISLESSTELAAKIRQRLKEIPEVVDVVSQLGRPDDGTDVNGYDNIEIFVSMKAPEDWKTAKTLDGFVAIAQDKLKDLPGVDFNFSQPIKDNVDEAISGVKGELVVKVFGPQLSELQKIGDEIEAVVKKIPGAEDVASEQILGQPELRFKMNRDLLARYGLRVIDAEDVLETALLGKTASKLVDEQGRSIDIVVKPNLPNPPTLNVLSSLPIMTPDGARIPLGEVSNAGLVEGVARVYRELGARRIAVKCSVRGRDVVSFVNEASKKIKEQVKMSDKYHVEWSGSFENAQRAARQLMFVVPLCLLAMVVLLFSWFKDWKKVGYLLWEIPFAGAGGILFIRLFGLNFSISAAAGGVVLIGVTFLTGMMFITEFSKTGDAWKALSEKGKSILLSNGVAIIGLVPAAFSTGIGSETAKPFAVMILGGLVSSLILSLTLLPGLVAVSDSSHKEG